MKTTTGTKNPSAVALGRLGGLAGKGKRSEDCRKAARARWAAVRASKAAAEAEGVAVDAPSGISIRFIAQFDPATPSPMPGPDDIDPI
jgi:hypothetical protein